MKIFAILALSLLTCAACDAPNQSSERGAGSESVEHAPVDPAETQSEHEPNENAPVERDSTSGQNSEGHRSDTIR